MHVIGAYTNVTLVIYKPRRWDITYTHVASSLELQLVWLLGWSLGLEKVDSISSNKSSTSDIGSSSIEQSYVVCQNNNFVYQDPGGHYIE